MTSMLSILEFTVAYIFGSITYGSNGVASWEGGIGVRVPLNWVKSLFSLSLLDGLIVTNPCAVRPCPPRGKF